MIIATRVRRAAHNPYALDKKISCSHIIVTLLFKKSLKGQNLLVLHHALHGRRKVFVQFGLIALKLFGQKSSPSTSWSSSAIQQL